MPTTYRDFTYEQIASEFVYDPEAGTLCRKMPDGSLRQCSLVQEAKDWTDPDREKYVAARAKFHGHQIKVTHIMFMLMTHRWPAPDHVIDHRDRDVFNCRWSNLREANKSQSVMNRETWGRSTDNTEGLERGVYTKRGKYRVNLCISGDGLPTYLGTYATKEEANAVARKVRAELHGEFLAEASSVPAPPVEHRTWAPCEHAILYGG